MDMSNCPVGYNDPVLVGQIGSLAQCLVRLFFYPGTILRMDPLKYRFAVRRAPLRIEAPNPEIFLRPVDGPFGVGLEGPAASVAEPLCFRQVRLASLQLVVCQLAF